VIATLLFVTNIFFWRDTDYFSPLAITKPLLHLWSLAVEEQFYIIFPPLLVVAARWGRRVTLAIVAIVTFGSLALAAAAIALNADIPAFFMLPTRAWELGAGAMLALSPSAAGSWRQAFATPLAWIGAILVAVTIGISADLPYTPAALPVVVGAVLILNAPRGNATPISRALAWPPLVFIGLISYSLYLWHWPLIVFVQYYLVGPLGWLDRLILFGASIGCAILSWRYIERPFRKRAMSMRKVGFSMLGCAALLGVAAATLIFSGGLPARLQTEAATINQAVLTNYRCPVRAYLSFGASRACELNLPSRNPADADVVLLGNSHAQMYAPAFEALLRQRGLHGLLVPLGGCLPTPDVNLVSCGNQAETNARSVESLVRVKVVVVGLTWIHDPGTLVDGTGRPLDNAQDAAVLHGLDRLIARLQRAGKRVIILGPIPRPGWNVASDASRALRFGRPLNRALSVDRAAFESEHGAALRHFDGRDGVAFVAPHRALCGPRICQFIVDGHALYADDNHLAVAELWRVEPSFGVALNDVLRAANHVPTP
jgi:peptidoglycan/LPS O-acetylase OafA/YrhL